MEKITNDYKEKMWNELLNQKNKPFGMTIKRLEKLKSLIWYDNNFWFFIRRKPEDMDCIAMSELVHYKIIK